MLPMARVYPEFGVVHVRSDHFLESAMTVLTAEELYQRVVNVGAVWGKKASPRTEFMEKEEIILPSQLSVISFCGFFLQFLPFFQLLVVRKRDTCVVDNYVDVREAI